MHGRHSLGHGFDVSVLEMSGDLGTVGHVKIVTLSCCVCLLSKGIFSAIIYFAA